MRACTAHACSTCSPRTIRGWPRSSVPTRFGAVAHDVRDGASVDPSVAQMVRSRLLRVPRGGCRALPTQRSCRISRGSSGRVSTVFDAADVELLDVETLRRLPPDAWPSLRLRLVPALEVLRSRLAGASHLGCRRRRRVGRRLGPRGRAAAGLASGRSRLPGEHGRASSASPWSHVQALGTSPRCVTRWPRSIPRGEVASTAARARAAMDRRWPPPRRRSAALSGAHRVGVRDGVRARSSSRLCCSPANGASRRQCRSAIHCPGAAARRPSSSHGCARPPRARAAASQPRTRHRRADGSALLHQPAAVGAQPLPPPARAQSRGLVPVGRRGVRARRAARTSSCCSSVGYATCHWCHVMEEESFEDEEIAARHERATTWRSRSTAKSARTSTRIVPAGRRAPRRVAAAGR